MGAPRVLNDRYELGEQLGKGGFGTVCRATDRDLGGAVAVKLLDERWGRGRFELEIEALSQLRHPHIVQLLDNGVDEESEQPFLVMEYLEGQPLRALLRQAPVDWPRGVGIARQIAAALAHLHVSDVVHRDLKPDNVMLLDYPGISDYVKVLDFGIIKLTGAGLVRADEDVTAVYSRSFIGPPQYQPPEEWKKDPLDGRADLYSLGLILYELLTGRRPFQGCDNPAAWMYAHTEAPVPPLLPVREPPSPLPGALEVLVRRLMAKEPDGRPRNAVALIEEFDALPGSRTGVDEAPVRPGTASWSGASPFDQPSQKQPPPDDRTPKVPPPGAGSEPARAASGLPGPLLLLVGLVMFAAGAGVTWLLLRGEDPPSPPPPSPGVRLLFSDPPGAHVKLFNLDLGKTPVDTRLDLPLGMASRSDNYEVVLDGRRIDELVIRQEKDEESCGVLLRVHAGSRPPLD